VTHYDTLEVSRQASPEVVRAAYRSLIQRFHPDRRPGNAAAATRAAAITEAYRVLSDPARRADYDRGLAASSTASVPASAASMAATPGPQMRAPAHPAARSRKIGVRLLWAMLAVSVAWCAAWLAAPRPDAVAELASIRLAFAAGGLPEARLRALHARKLALLEQAPQVRARVAAETLRDREARTFDLLDTPLVVQLPRAEFTIPRLRIVLGSFDAGSLRAHIGRGNESLTSEIARNVALADAAQLTGPASEAFLKKLVLDVLARELGTDPGEDYPSTYFESPGRHGVVDVLLPARPALRPL
jgi:curved DNA-binding protein CbpA